MSVFFTIANNYCCETEALLQQHYQAIPSPADTEKLLDRKQPE